MDGGANTQLTCPLSSKKKGEASAASLGLIISRDTYFSEQFKHGRRADLADLPIKQWVFGWSR
jgi:hypothetical protein